MRTKGKVIQLNDKQLFEFKQLVDSYPTLAAAKEDLQISNISWILLTGKTQDTTYEKILRKLSTVQNN